MPTTFVSVQLLPRHWKAAEERAEKMPVLKKSQRGKEANIVGCLGEIVFMEYLHSEGVEFTEDFATSHDITIVGSGTLDIKTKDRTVPPKPEFEASISLYNHEHQDVDYWAFISLERGRPLCGHDGCTLFASGHPFGGPDTPSCDHDLVEPKYVKSFHHAHIVGISNRAILAHFGTQWNTGDTDPSNGMTFKMDSLNLPFSVLKPVREASKIWLERQETPF